MDLDKAYNKAVELTAYIVSECLPSDDYLVQQMVEDTVNLGKCLSQCRYSKVSFYREEAFEVAHNISYYADVLEMIGKLSDLKKARINTILVEITSSLPEYD